MSETILDVVVIGSGPAGVSAAINAKVRNKSVKLFGYKHLSNKIVKAHRVDNYLGLPQITGPELKDAFYDHLTKMDLDITEEKITAVYPNGDTFMIIGANQMYHAKTVIIASGVDLGKQIENELNLLGAGVSYCATCDAMLYKGKDVAIIGYNEEGEHEANFVAEIVNKVYYIPVNSTPSILHESVEVVKDVPLKIEGEQYVTGLQLRGSHLAVDGVFVLRDSVEPSQLMAELEIDNKHIKVSRLMETSVPGVFAAGDVVGRPYQYLKAAGEGLIAGLSAAEYIDRQKLK
ncbi:MAG: NAD(P)/FAD-dependent oxidoreductase [Erysipelotrichaceae bacterium]